MPKAKSKLVETRTECAETFLLDDDEEPTEYWMFCREIQVFESPVRRKRREVIRRFIHTLTGRNRDELNEQLIDLLDNQNFQLVPDF